MKSGESPVFSDPNQTGITTEFEFRRPEVPRTSAAVKRRLQVNIRDVIFPSDGCAYSLSKFYQFPATKQARIWESFELKQEPAPEHWIRNQYKSQPSDKEETTPLQIPSKSIILTHATLKLDNFDPKYIFIPNGEKELTFSRVHLQRKTTDSSNLQVLLNLNALNPWFCPTSVLLEASSSPDSKRVTASKQNRGELKRGAGHLDNEHLLSALRGAKHSYRVSSTNASGVPYIPDLAHHQPGLTLEGFRPQHTAAVSLRPIAFPIQSLPRPSSVQSATHSPRPSVIRTPPTPSQTSAFGEARVVLCGNCGVQTENLATCDRCKKPITIGRITPSSTTPLPAVLSRRKVGKENETKEEVVELSSDDNEDSQEEIAPKTPSSNAAMDYQLFTLFSTPQNGKDSPSDKITPEEVIKVLSENTSGSGEPAMFVMVTCSYIRIGTYMVSSGKRPMFATIGEIGMYFELPGYKSGETKRIGLPRHQILNLYGHFDSHDSYLKIQTGPKFASWVRKTLDMDLEPNGDCYFCPIEGDESQQEFILMFSDHDKNKAAVVKRLYESVLVAEDEKHKSILATSGTSSLVRVVWDGPNSTTVTLSKPLSELPASKPPLPPIQGPLEPRKLFHYPVIPSEVYMDTSITISNTDINCLGDEQYLNDQVMDFWMRHILEQLSPENKARAHFFNTFFYKRLTTKPKSKRKSVHKWEFDASITQAEKRHLRVKGWTKKVDIFKKDFLFIPINESAHWFLAVICFPGLVPLGKPDGLKAKKHSKKNIIKLPELDENEEPDRDEALGDPDEDGQGEPMENEDVGNQSNPEPALTTPVPKPTLPNVRPCIVVFDSLGSENRCKLYATLREYLQIEHNTRKAPEIRIFDSAAMPGMQPGVPMQPNGFDCGLYVLQYTEKFFSTPITNFTTPQLMKTKDWFLTSEVESKREEMYNVIVNYVKANFPENSKYVLPRAALVEAGPSHPC